MRKLQDIRFPGRTAVERYAVAALAYGTPLARPGVAAPDASVADVGPREREVTARPLADDVWRLDWRPPPGKDRSRPTCWWRASARPSRAGTRAPHPLYQLLDTGVHTVHHRLARRWRSGRALLAWDAAHLLGALGTQGAGRGPAGRRQPRLELALAWHHGPHEALLDSYQAERRAVVAARLRAADQALPLLRSGGGLRSACSPGSPVATTRCSRTATWDAARWVRRAYADSPLAPAHTESATPATRPPARRSSTYA